MNGDMAAGGLTKQSSPQNHKTAITRKKLG